MSGRRSFLPYPAEVPGLAAGEGGNVGPCNPTIISGLNTLVVDPINGNDQFGGFNGTPIKTIARLNALMCGTFISGGSVTVRVLSSPPSTDAELDLTINYENAIINPNLPGSGVTATPFLMFGSLTNVAHSGTLATVMPVAYAAPPATPTRETVTDTTVTNWEAYVYQPLIQTSGPDAGFFAWVAPPLPSSLSTGYTSSPTTIGGFPAALSAGNTYNIINQTQIKLRQITVIGDGTGITEFHDLYFINWQNTFAEYQSANAVINNFDSLNLTGTGLIFGRCRFDIAVTGAGQTVGLVACCLTPNEFVSGSGGTFGGNWEIIAGILVPITNIATELSVASTYVYGYTFGSINPNGNTTNTAFFSVPPVTVTTDQGVQFWDWLPAFDGQGVALQIIGTTIICAAPLFGRSANVETCGIEISGGGKLILLESPFTAPTPAPNLSGAGHYLGGSNGTDTDFTLDDLLNSAGGPVARAWEEGAGAYTAQIATTWVNFNTAQPAGFAANPADTTSRANAQSAASGSLIAKAFIGD
jgi:hypothetical protein